MPEPNCVAITLLPIISIPCPAATIPSSRLLKIRLNLTFVVPGAKEVTDIPDLIFRNSLLSISSKPLTNAGIFIAPASLLP